MSYNYGGIPKRLFEFQTQVLRALPYHLLTDEIIDEWNDNPNALRRVLGGLVPPPKKEMEQKPEPFAATFTLDTTNPSWPGEWTEANGWKVYHRGLGIITVRFRGGEMYINDQKVEEYLSPEQERGGTVGGNKLHAKLLDKPVLPDAILFLLIREQGNPAVAVFLKKYKGRHPFFWGSIYEAPDGSLFVRYLYRGSERFGWGYFWLGDDWSLSHPALVLERPLNTGV